jgi:Fungal Zn(2)-Cys(6) binuclear cluster domain
MNSTGRASKACDACRRRKVKCNGRQSCQQCAHLNLACFYSEIPSSSRSRKSIVRGRVINACKSPEAFLSPQRPLAPRFTPSEEPSASNDGLGLSSSSAFDASFFTDLIPDYVTSILPVLPIIGESEFRSAIDGLQPSRHDRALVYVLGAITMNMTRMGPRHPLSNINQVTSLYTTALEIRGPVMPQDRISVRGIMIPVVTSICLLANHHDAEMGFYYLREAITRIQVLRVNESEIMAQLSAGERAQRERMYWLLFIHERYFSINHRQSAVLAPLPDYPGWDSSIPAGVMEGFDQIISLFRIIDADFIENWINRELPSVTFTWIEKKQAELCDSMDAWENEIRALTDMQQIDLIVTRYWLLTLLWQMALSKLLLTSIADSEKDFLSFMFPVHLSHRLRSIIAAMPREAVEIHGTGILRKIFDIAATIADILVHVPTAAANHKTDLDHIDSFLFLYRFLLSMSKFYHVEEAVLRAKFLTLKSLFPLYHDMSD